MKLSVSMSLKTTQEEQLPRNNQDAELHIQEKVF